MSETETTSPVDPAAVPMNLEGLNAEAFSGEKVLEHVSKLTDEQVDKTIAELTRVRNNISDSRRLLGTMVNVLSIGLDLAFRAK